MCVCADYYLLNTKTVHSMSIKCAETSDDA